MDNNRDHLNNYKRVLTEKEIRILQEDPLRMFKENKQPKIIAGEDIHPMDMLEIGEDGKAYKADLTSENAKSYFFGPAKVFVAKDDNVFL